MEFNRIALYVLLTGALSFAIAVFAWQRRYTNGARPFALFMAAMSLYILGYGMELASPNLETMLFWNKIEYIGILTFPTLFLIFVFQFTGRVEWFNRRNLLLLFALPLIFLILKFLDDDLHLIYASVEVDSSGSIPLLAFTRSPIYLVISAYNLLMVTIGNALLLWKRRYASSIYQKQTSIMLQAALILYVLYGVYLSGIPIFPNLIHLDLNPVVYILWGAAIFVAIFRFRLFDLTPIARDALIERLSDGVIVLDLQTRLVDANPEALKIFGWSKPPVGQQGKELLKFWDGLDTLSTLEQPAHLETQSTNNGAVRYDEVAIIPLKEKRGEKIGYLLVVHDITERKDIEHRLHELSVVDELTGLTNLRGFRLLSAQLIGMASRMKLCASLFYMDMDRLKWINDNLGHAVGDQALIDTASILRTTFRASDVIARIGGDEFVVLVLDAKDKSQEILLKRLQEHLDDYHAQPNRTFKLSFSVGFARFDYENPRSIEVLLDDADKMMYAKKLSLKSSA